jgi:hypothetical protein
MAGRVTPEERAAIVAALHGGTSLHAVAAQFGRGKATVSVIARDAGIDFERSAVRKAGAVHRDYALAERVALLNLGFDRARELLPTIEGALHLQQWMTAMAIGIDKRRLEDGDVTDRTAVQDHRESPGELVARITHLAARRRAG